MFAARSIISKAISGGGSGAGTGTALGTVLGTENFIFAGDNANGSTTITDSSSNALAVSNTNGANTVTNSTTQSARGTASYAMNTGGYWFTGSTAKAYMGGASSWTFDCFVFMTALPSTYWQVVFCSTGGNGWDTAHMFDLTINSAGKCGLEWANGASSPAASIGIGTAMATNTWYHIAVVWDSVGKTIKIYLNGVLDTTTNVTTFSSYSTTPRVTIGRTDPNVSNPVYTLNNSFIDRARLTPSVRWTSNFTPD